MEENEIVRRCGVTQEEWARMLALSNARRRRYHKGEAVLRCGDRGKELGLVEQGSVNIETVDLSGSRSILGHIPRGQVFAETYAFCREVLMVDVTAAEESQILFLNIHALLLPQYAGESWQRKLLTGLLAMSTYYMQQKQQETAVRKVFGATRREMLRRLVGNFMAQVAVAFLIAVPVAWYALDRWLQDYSVRIRLGAWIFLAAGAFAATVALATVFWQSSRAAAANPVDALKN